MHRVIIKCGEGEEVDHVDRNGLNNQKHNLRKCDRFGNAKNTKAHANSTSNYKGVSWSKERQKWVVYIMSNKKQIFLGRFDSEKEAALKYNEVAKQLHREFANLNTVV